MLKLLPSKRMQNFQPHLSYVATLHENTITTNNERFVWCLPLKSVGGSEKSRLDHDENQQRSIESVQSDGR